MNKIYEADNLRALSDIIARYAEKKIKKHVAPDDRVHYAINVGRCIELYIAFIATVLNARGVNTRMSTLDYTLVLYARGNSAVLTDGYEFDCEEWDGVYKIRMEIRDLNSNISTKVTLDD